MEVDLGGFHRLVAEPQGDDRPVDSVLKQVHGKAVPEYMGRDSFLSQGWAFAPCGGDVLGKDVSQPVMAETLTPSVGKEGISGTSVKVAHPSPQSGDRVFAQRGATFPTPLPQATNMGTTAQRHVLTTQTD